MRSETPGKKNASVHFAESSPAIIPPRSPSASSSDGGAEAEQEEEPEATQLNGHGAEVDNGYGDGEGEHAVALYDFQAQGEDELSVGEGEGPEDVIAYIVAAVDWIVDMEYIGRHLSWSLRLQVRRQWVGPCYVCVRWSCPAARRVLRNHSCSQCMHLQTRLFYNMLDSISCKKVNVVVADYHFNIACEPKAQLYIGSEVPPIPSPLMSRETCDTNYTSFCIPTQSMRY